MKRVVFGFVCFAIVLLFSLGYAADREAHRVETVKVFILESKSCNAKISVADLELEMNAWFRDNQGIEVVQRCLSTSQAECRMVIVVSINYFQNSFKER